MKAPTPMRSSLFAWAVILTLSLPAWAQEETPPLSPSPGAQGEEADQPERTPGEGFRSGHFRIVPSITLDAYFNDNVFRTGLQDSPDTTTAKSGAGVARLFGKVTGSRGGGPGQNAALFEAGLGYNQYISGDPAIRNLSGLDASLLGRYQYQPKGKVSWFVENNFQRSTSPRTIRIGSELLSPTFRQDTNRFLVGTRLRPQGGVLEQQIAYSGTLSIFETAEFVTANHFKHDFSTYTKWNFFPRTAAIFEAHFGYNDFFRDANVDQFGNVDSMPLRVTLGALGIIKNRIQFRADLGYGNSFHRPVADPARNVSFSGIIGKLGFRANIADRDILTATYSHDFADSLFGNFIRRDQLDFSITHAFSRQFQGTASVRMSLDRYSDLPPLIDQQPLQENRIDFPFAVSAKGEYFFRKDLRVGGNISAIANVSNFQVLDLISGGINDASYFQLMAGVHAAYVY